MGEQTQHKHNTLDGAKSSWSHEVQGDLQTSETLLKACMSRNTRGYSSELSSSKPGKRASSNPAEAGRKRSANGK